jgi:Fe-S cluster biogenesis protein NfuA
VDAFLLYKPHPALFPLALLGGFTGTLLLTATLRLADAAGIVVVDLPPLLGSVLSSKPDTAFNAGHAIFATTGILVLPVALALLWPLTPGDRFTFRGALLKGVLYGVALAGLTGLLLPLLGLVSKADGPGLLDPGPFGLALGLGGPVQLLVGNPALRGHVRDRRGDGTRLPAGRLGGLGLVVAWQRRVTVTAEPGPPPPEITAALQQLDELLTTFARHPDEAVQEAVVALLRAVDVLHRGAIHRTAALLDEQSLIEKALADPYIAVLFELYESNDDGDERARAEAAVEALRPEIEALGGQIELSTSDGGAVNIRLLGATNDSTSTAELRRLVEDALRTELPDFDRLDITALSPSPQARPPEPVFIPLSALKRRDRAQGDRAPRR